MIGVSPVEMNGMVNRSQDISIIKHNDDVKPMVDQGNSQAQVEKNVEHRASTVTEVQNADIRGENSGGGLGSYFGDGGRNRKKKQPVERVVEKRRGGGFDFSV